jgi:hypothetical protein
MGLNLQKVIDKSSKVVYYEDIRDDSRTLVCKTNAKKQCGSWRMERYHIGPPNFMKIQNAIKLLSDESARLVAEFNIAAANAPSLHHLGSITRNKARLAEVLREAANWLKDYEK